MSAETIEEFSANPTQFCYKNIIDKKAYCQELSSNDVNRTVGGDNDGNSTSTGDSDGNVTRDGSNSKEEGKSEPSKNHAGNEVLLVFDGFNETTRNTWYFFNENGDSCHREADFKDIPVPDGGKWWSISKTPSFAYDPDHDILFYAAIGGYRTNTFRSNSK